MVRSIKLSRFRSYKNGRLDLCPRVNGIIGISQSGKTNIIRAMKWVSSLKPTSKSVVHNRREKTDAKVELEFYDGQKVSLEKGLKTSGSYICNGTTYRKFGRTVPEPVQEALNLSGINFHGQFDSPFLVMSNPAEISRVINDMTGMDDFDRWIDKTNEEIRNIKAEKRLLETSHEMNLIELESMDRLEECEPLLKKAAELKKERITLERDYEKIEEIHNNIQNLKKKIEKAKQIVVLKPEIEKLDRIRKKLYKAEDKHDVINKVISQEHLIEMAIEEYRDLNENYSKLLKMARRCPTCFSPIRQSTIKRITDEFHFTFRSSRDGKDSGWTVR